MRMRPALRKILFITLPSIFIFLFLIELSLRIGGYLYTKYHNPDIYSKTKDSNSGAFNILCLGDSFTFGVGTTPENSYPRQLERLLRENTSEDINVINRGIPASSSSLLLQQLQGDINQYQPNTIIIMIGCNDVNDVWNLEESSYFILNPSFYNKLERLLIRLRVYKLAKIGWISLKHKMEKVNKLFSDKNLTYNINPKSIKCCSMGDNLYHQGEYDLAIEKFKEALTVDKNNYYAHTGLAMIHNVRKEYQLARQEIWEATKLINEWNEAILSRIIFLIHSFDNVTIGRESELTKLKKYLQDKYSNDNNIERLVKMINLKLELLKNENIITKVLEYNLRNIIKKVKKKDIRVLLLTYPHNFLPVNPCIRKMSEIYNIPLVDNEFFFEEIPNKEDFFVADRHCNAQGYGLIATNVYSTLVKTGILSKNTKIVETKRRR